METWSESEPQALFSVAEITNVYFLLTVTAEGVSI